MSKEVKDWKKVRDKHQENDIEQESTEENEATNADTKKTKKNQDEAALTHPSYEKLEAELTEAEQKAHENWEKLMRVQAELENVRRRFDREISNAHRYGSEKLIQSLLPVIDSLEQALQIAKDGHDDSMREGIELTMKLFLDVLTKNDVSELNPLGEPFNPLEHEAMSVQESEEAAPNTVLMVFQKGYKLHDRIIRPARVIVSK